MNFRLTNDLRIQPRWIAVAFIFCLFESAQAGMVGYLAEFHSDNGSSVKVDFFLASESDLVGREMEFVNLDIVNSTVNANALMDPTAIRFEAVAPFDDWQDGQQFGSKVGFETQITLDAFANMSSSPFLLADQSPFQLGTFELRYGQLGLADGDEMTIDIRGVFDGMSSTTTIGVFDPDSGAPELFDPNFSTPSGPGFRTYTVGANPVPEFSTFVLFGLSMGSAGWWRRKARHSK